MEIANKNQLCKTDAQRSKAIMRETIVPVRHTACRAKPIQVIRALSSRTIRIVRAYEAIPQAKDTSDPIAQITNIIKLS